MSGKIGFVGLGIMGYHMAENIIKAGYTVVVYNRTLEKAQGLVELGAIVANSPREVAEQGVRVIVTMLAHPQAVRECALGENGFLDYLSENALWIDSSTLNPTDTTELADQAISRGLRFIDAPVAGSKPTAEAGELTVIVGGADSDVEEATPIFEAIGNRIVHAGGIGKAISLKICINQQLAIGMMAYSESFALGKSLGLDEDLLIKVLMYGPTAPPFLKMRSDQIVNGNWDNVFFPLRWMQKDLQMSTTTANNTNIALPLSNTAKEIYRLADMSGYGDLDFSSIHQYLQPKQ